MSLDTLRQNAMMAHLIDALQRQEDIGHYGRLVFAMVARHFLSESELITLLQQNPGVTEQEARSLFLQVQGKDYSPPRRSGFWRGGRSNSSRSARILKIRTRVMSTKISNFLPRSTSTSRGTTRARRRVLPRLLNRR